MSSLASAQAGLKRARGNARKHGPPAFRTHSPASVSAPCSGHKSGGKPTNVASPNVSPKRTCSTTGVR
eukprot:14802103-Alexandrium_andersonii.AAC.1